jgi:RHH-type proline utilization regulon transcriptional repressor/proline dehydrogenase/delta 1-pyrroline-5-carboxylate dehydrogenase
MPSLDAPRAAAPRLPSPYRGEAEVVDALAARLAGLDWPAAARDARPWVEAVRRQPAPFWALESLLREYPISSAEGLALMRLAESLLRVPDTETAIALTADQLGHAHFEAVPGSAHPLLAGLAASAIVLSKRLLPDGSEREPGLLKRLGAQTVVGATVRAIQLLGRQFVLGRSIEEALKEATAARTAHTGLRFSYDMLGEGARTDADALRYLASYRHAIDTLAAGETASSAQVADGISIKLSALFPRYEEAQRERVFDTLLPRAWPLIEAAARANLNLTLDAEESDRLELSLDLLDAWSARIADEFPHWQGFGLAVQAYQTRALDTVHAVVRMAQRHRLRFMVRLVKGAYWDGEIKRAQEMGLIGYPVFTRKSHTDLSYLACARELLAQPDAVYPQFATHNAGTVAAVLRMAHDRGAAFEMQRLHGMGEAVYREVRASSAGKPLPLRIYAPVGEHRDLLAYLVRRLLENGANSSFVHQLSDDAVPVDVLLASPLLDTAQEPGLPSPRALYGARTNSLGLDLSCAPDRALLQQALDTLTVVSVRPGPNVDLTMGRLHAGFPAWNATPLTQRAATLRRAADALQSRLPEFCALLVDEGRKTWSDAVSEVREAIDFCRYYADEAQLRLQDQTLPGPTGESNRLRLRGRGVFVCISPWNFPLAIFAGQVVAALVAGNAVAAKPAEQTPAVAARMVALLHDAGVPQDALALLHGPGEIIGAALVADARTAGVCFTGSTAVARHIHRALAAKDGPIVPLIAETGGLNAMLVDSSALPEQVVDAVVQSAFRSAGQRCSALRLLCVQDDVADALIEMLRGAMQELRVGEPALWSTDVGPVIDEAARAALQSHIDRLRVEARCLGESPPPAEHDAPFIAPIAFELAHIADLREEIFGPVLHVVRWSGDVLAVIAQINALGYGLTLGIQTRIDSRALQLAEAAHVGNVYVNRNMVAALVGVQPFGGEGLSGTGPKAGGPHYLYRFCSEQVLTINTAAAGGNVALLTGGAT